MRNLRRNAPIFIKPFHKIEWEGLLQDSSYEASILLIPKSDKDMKKKENYKGFQDVS
jgi:hypothetical protein